MPSVHHFALHFKKYGFTHKTLYTFSLIFFFWGLFDGIISYVTPLALTQSGLTTTVMGFIISSSSVFGAIFDLVLSRILLNTNFRRTIFLTLMVSFVQPLLLWQAKTIPLFVIAMATWGLYYDLSNFGMFDFVGRQMKPEEHVSSFGVIEVLRSLGYLLAPIIAGILVVEMVDLKAYAVAWVFLVVALVFYFALLYLLKREKRDFLEEVKLRPVNFLRKIAIWKVIGKKIFPILALTSLFFVYDAFFWTIGPLYIEGLQTHDFLSGSILTAYTLPALLLGWFMGGIVAKFGKNRSIFVAGLLGFLVLIAFPFVNSVLLIVAVVFVSSCLTSISLTTIRGVYADYIQAVPKEETEIEALGDFSTNIGYVIGPVTAGFLADKIGNAQSFAALGIAGSILVLILYKFSGVRYRLEG